MLNALSSTQRTKKDVSLKVVVSLFNPGEVELPCYPYSLKMDRRLARMLGILPGLEFTPREFKARLNRYRMLVSIGHLPQSAAEIVLREFDFID